MTCRDVAAFRSWDFLRNGDADGWVLAALTNGLDAPIQGAGPVVMGGSAWVSLRSPEADPVRSASVAFQIYGNAEAPALAFTSPPGLALPAVHGEWQLRVRLLNLSPNTELVGLTRSAGADWQTARSFGSVHSDLKQWQVVVIPLESAGALDQVGVRFTTRARGDVWFDRIELLDGPPPPKPARRLDVASSATGFMISGPMISGPMISGPMISVPGIDQPGFADAFAVLDECLITDVALAGLDGPAFAPGGAYAQPRLWFSLDGALALQGAKWADPALAEDGVRAFRGALAQNPDGRLDLYTAAITRGQVGDASSFPAILEVGYDIARRSPDLVLRAEVCDLLQRSLGWWLSPNKRDAGTGLVSAVFEETFGEVAYRDHEDASVLGVRPGTLAPVDLNVALTLGCQRLARLLGSLGQHEPADHYRVLAAELATAIETHLWDEEAGVYRSYDLTTGERRAQLSAATFDPLQLGLAADRVARLTVRLTDPAQFNWGRVPLTSIAMTDPRFEIAVGPYDGRAWFGDVWTFRNLPVIAGLRASGRPDLAADLAWATITAFHANYCEFLDPRTGDGHGVQRYAWSAAQYVQAVVEHLFGVDVDAIDAVLRIAPHVPPALAGRDLVLESLVLPWPGRPRLSVRLGRTGAGTTLTITIDGAVPDLTLVTEIDDHPTRRAPLRATQTITYEG